MDNFSAPSPFPDRWSGGQAGQGCPGGQGGRGCGQDCAIVFPTSPYVLQFKICINRSFGFQIQSKFARILVEKLQPLWGNRPPPQVKPHFRCCHFLPSSSWCTLRAPILPTTSCWLLLTTNVQIMETNSWKSINPYSGSNMDNIFPLVCKWFQLWSFFCVDFSSLIVPLSNFHEKLQKNENKTVFYGKNESTNVAACWKTLLDGISSWQAMQMLWWEEIDCNSGKRGYKCGNSDAGIRLPGVNWSPLKEYLIHDGFKDAVNPHCWEAKWTLHVKILQWADLKMVIFTGSYKEQHRLAMIKWSEEIRNADYTFFCKAAIEK